MGDPQTIRDIVQAENAGPLARIEEERQAIVERVLAEDRQRLDRLIAERNTSVWWTQKPAPRRPPGPEWDDSPEVIAERRRALVRFDREQRGGKE